MLELTAFSGEKKMYGKYVRISQKTSSSISAELVDEMDLKSGQKVWLYHDKKNEKDWYLAKSDDGCVVRRYAGKSNSLLFNNAQFGKTLAKQFSITKPSFKIDVGEPVEIKGVKYYQLITAALNKLSNGS